MNNLLEKDLNNLIIYKISYLDFIEIIVDKETHDDFVCFLHFLSKLAIAGMSFIIVYSVSDSCQAIEVLKKTIKKGETTTVSNTISEGSLVIQKVGNTNIRKFVNLPVDNNSIKVLKNFSNEEIFGFITILFQKIASQPTSNIMLLEKPVSPIVLRPNAVWTKKLPLATIKNVPTRTYTLFEKVIFIASVVNLGELTIKIAKNIVKFVKKPFKKINSKIFDFQNIKTKLSKDEIRFQELVLIAENLKKQINNLPEIPIIQNCEEFFTKNYSKKDFMQTVLNIQGGAINLPIIPDGLNPIFYITRTSLNELYKILIIKSQNLNNNADNISKKKIEERKSVAQHTLDLITCLPTTVLFPLTFGFLVILPDSEILEEIKQYILSLFPYVSLEEKQEEMQTKKKHTFLEWLSVFIIRQI